MFVLLLPTPKSGPKSFPVAKAGPACREYSAKYFSAPNKRFEETPQKTDFLELRQETRPFGAPACYVTLGFLTALSAAEFCLPCWIFRLGN